MKKIICLVIVAVMIIGVSTVGYSAVFAPTHWYGDVDGSKAIEITDATQIQRYLVSSLTFGKLELILADFDGDGYISVLDATNIQMYIAKKPSNRRIDDCIYCYPEVDGVVASYSSGKAMAGVPVEFTITSSLYGDDERAYPFSYQVYILDEYYQNPTLIYSGASEMFEYTFEEAGIYYLQVYVYNDFGDCSISDMPYEVIEKSEDESLVATISSNKFYYTDGEKREFVAFAHGGNAPYEYCFTDGNKVYQDYSQNNTLTLDPIYDVDYYIEDCIIVYVRDANGNIASDVCAYEISPNLPR